MVVVALMLVMVVAVAPRKLAAEVREVFSERVFVP